MLLLLALFACVAESVVDSTQLSEPEAQLKFRFPADPSAFYPSVMGFDHDPDNYDGYLATVCTSFEGMAFPHCYDGHDGSDYDLIGGFDAMDAGSTPVVAGAPGKVIAVRDGQYDRCHLDFATMEPTCDGHEMKSNYVEILHYNGYVSSYVHFKKESVAVSVDQWVERGEHLGLVGSSGYSTAPHLHFELEDEAGRPVDPYAGPYSQPHSWWCAQSDGELPAVDCGPDWR